MEEFVEKTTEFVEKTEVSEEEDEEVFFTSFPYRLRYDELSEVAVMIYNYEDSNNGWRFGIRVENISEHQIALTFEILTAKERIIGQVSTGWLKPGEVTQKGTSGEEPSLGALHPRVYSFDCR